ncbi:MAG: PAS domain S-box, partial [Candidatus Uhrbacteria bacterium GW2011_GWB1_41_7]
ITESKKFEQQMQAANLDLQKFKLAVENASEHIIITDPNGKILYANAAAQKVTGFSLPELLGNTPRLWGGLMDPKYYQQMCCIEVECARPGCEVGGVTIPLDTVVWYADLPVLVQDIGWTDIKYFIFVIYCECFSPQSFKRIIILIIFVKTN